MRTHKKTITITNWIYRHTFTVVRSRFRSPRFESWSIIVRSINVSKMLCLSTPLVLLAPLSLFSLRGLGCGSKLVSGFGFYRSSIWCTELLIHCDLQKQNWNFHYTNNSFWALFDVYIKTIRCRLVIKSHTLFDMAGFLLQQIILIEHSLITSHKFELFLTPPTLYLCTCVTKD